MDQARLFQSVDAGLFAWAKQNSIQVATLHRDDPVRSFGIVSPLGARFQVWLDVPGENVTVHVWDFRTRSASFTGIPADIGELLDKARNQAQTWMADTSGIDWASFPDIDGRTDETGRLAGQLLRSIHRRGRVGAGLVESLSRRVVHQGTLSFAAVALVQFLLRACVQGTASDGAEELLDSITLGCRDPKDFLRAPQQEEIRTAVRVMLGQHYALNGIPKSAAWNRLAAAVGSQAVEGG